MSTEPVRMPDGVMDYLQNGASPVRQAEAETAAATGDPESYERALARQAERKPEVRMTGRSPMDVLAEWFAEDKAKASQEMFEAITGPEHKIDLTLPEVKSPTAAERASWRRKTA